MQLSSDSNAEVVGGNQQAMESSVPAPPESPAEDSADKQEASDHDQDSES